MTSLCRIGSSSSDRSVFDYSQVLRSWSLWPKIKELLENQKFCQSSYNNGPCWVVTWLYFTVISTTFLWKNESQSQNLLVVHVYQFVKIISWDQKYNKVCISLDIWLQNAHPKSWDWFWLVVLPLEPHIIEICSQQDVSTNRECINGVEVNACYSSLDCGGDRVCIQGVCTPRCTCTEVEQEICEGKLLSVWNTQWCTWYLYFTRIFSCARINR